MIINLSARSLMCGGALLLAVQAAQAVVLVHEHEAEQSRAAPAQIVPRAAPVPGAPGIRLVAPDTASTITSPTRIELRFEPGPQTSIRPETFRVLYGAFKLDITRRITANSQVSARGIEVAEAHLPKGSHRLLLEIQDSAGRVGERVISFVVD